MNDDFTRCRMAVVVAGRMKSTRLPGKALLPIRGVSSVERCLRQCVCVQRMDRVILATSDLAEDDVLAEITLDGKVDVWRGDPDDVIARYIGACEHYGIDVVVRVTADCPVVLPDLLELLVHEHFQAGADYTAAAQCAVGTAGEVINVSALRRVVDHFGRAEFSEYMTWYFRNNADVFKVKLVDLPESMRRDYRLTLDYPADLEMFERLFSTLPASEEGYRSDEVFSVLDANPDIAQVNRNLTLRYVADDALVGKLNKMTRMR